MSTTSTTHELQSQLTAVRPTTSPAKVPTMHELQAQIAALSAALAAAQSRPASTVSLKLGQAGGIVFAGLGAHPWSPYLSQLMAVVRSIASGDVERFVMANLHNLAQKEGRVLTAEDIKAAFAQLKQ